MARPDDPRLVDARAHSAAGRYREALDLARECAALADAEVGAILLLGDLHLRLGQHREALMAYERVAQRYTDAGETLKTIAVYEQMHGILQRHAPDLVHEYDHVLHRLAESYLRHGSVNAIGTDDEDASRLRDESLGEAAGLLLNLGRIDDAIGALERLLERRSDPAVARLCGLAYLERGGEDDGYHALAKLKLAYTAAPRDPETLSGLARAFEAVGQPEKAAEVRKEAARQARGSTATTPGSTSSGP